MDASKTLALAFSLAIATTAVAQQPSPYGSAPTAAASPAVAAGASLTGTWQPREDAKQRASRHQAIDQATESLNWMMRGKAREKLRSATASSDEVSIADAGQQVTLETPEQRMTVATDGRPTKVSTPEMTGTVRAIRSKGNLTVEVAGERGTRTTTYIPSRDGRTLTLDVQMSSARLAKPIRYQATYLRK
ncbi:MAG: hypothetical protein AAGJ46_16955 [Planctomycetota bacterium]